MVRGSRDPPAIHVFEFHPQIKWVPSACVLARGMLFTVRGLLAQIGRGGNARRPFVCKLHDTTGIEP